MPCLFCKIIAGEIPSKKVFEDDLTYAFRDINPQAPTHVLVVPRKHIASLAETGVEDEALLGYLHLVAARIANDERLANGFRTVMNTGSDGGQTVDHLHVHLLGGRALGVATGLIFSHLARAHSRFVPMTVISENCVRTALSLYCFQLCIESVAAQ